MVYRWMVLIMTRPIEVGDKVHIMWESPERVTHLQGEVLHTPSDTGDMWYIKTNDTNEIVAVNSQNSYLSTITKLEEV